MPTTPEENTRLSLGVRHLGHYLLEEEVELWEEDPAHPDEMFRRIRLPHELAPHKEASVVPL
jgi:hypothetical protein